MIDKYDPLKICVARQILNCRLKISYNEPPKPLNIFHVLRLSFKWVYTILKGTTNHYIIKTI